MPKKTESLASGAMLGAESKKQLQAFKDRIINLLDERDRINTDVSEVFNEVKDAGLDSKVLRRAVAIARKDPEKFRAEQEVLDSYLEAIQPDLFKEAA